MGSDMERLPIVYVRGYAGGQRGIEKAVDDPFYGFNDGSVHVRVGHSGDPSFYQFESPLLRLMIDESYQLLVRGSQESFLLEAGPGEVPDASIWIHRFYDVSAPSLTSQAHQPGPDDDDLATPAEHRPFDLIAAAEALRGFIALVKEKTGAPRVHLVAHSMGGLVCRCLIQKVLPDRGEHALDHVDRLFTYGTPHGGIHFDIGWGLIERARDAVDFQGGGIFGPRRMYDYLTPEGQKGRKPPKAWKANVVPPEAFPGERIFCLVGTNPADYDVALGLSAKAVGPKSDGLVQVESAYVPDARFAFVHRSHSGRYGMVNSEEGYQNLRRFLFGDLAVMADLVDYRLPGEPDPEVVWQAETKLSIRGLPIVMHEQLAAHHCPIQLEWPKDRDTADRPVPLVTTFLQSSQKPEGTGRNRYLLQLRVISLRERNGVFGFRHHLEQGADLDDMLVVDVAPPDEGDPYPRAWARWASAISTPLRGYEATDDDLLEDANPEPGVWDSYVELPQPAGGFLGDKARIHLRVQGRSTIEQARQAAGLA
jgi:pimeloyl-ACP methyl ester carboxylesterase